MRERVPVGELSTQVRGVTYRAAEASTTPRSGTVGVVRAGNIVDGELTTDDLVYVPASRVAEKQWLLHGDVLIATSSGSLDVVGKAARIRRDEGVAFGAFCKVLRPVPQVDFGYFAHFFQTTPYRRHVASVAAGSNINNLKSVDLDSIEISLPPMEEQRRIAAVLDAAEALRAKRRQALAKLDGLTQAIFHDMFGVGDSSIWKVCPIVELADSARGSIRTGPFGSQLLHEEFTSEGPVAVLGIDNVVSNRFEWGTRRFITAKKYEGLERYTVRPGDVLVTIMGTCGRVAVVPSDIPLAINTKHLCCISLNQDRCLPEFLWACLRFHPDVLKQLGATRGAVMPGLNMGLIKRAEMPVPPRDIQLEFVRRKTQVDEQLMTASEHLAQLDDLFASLQQRAFRGEL